MVFQSYALFPHLSVFNNIVFGLKNMKVPKDIQREKADRMLTLVQLEGPGRSPAQRAQRRSAAEGSPLPGP